MGFGSSVVETRVVSFKETYTNRNKSSFVTGFKFRGDIYEVESTFGCLQSVNVGVLLTFERTMLPL
jgi:hypothetical protein